MTTKSYVFLLIQAIMLAEMFAATQEERLLALEDVALYKSSDWIDENEIIPTPLDVKKKFNLTDENLYLDIMELANKYTITETNNEKRVCRSSAIGWLGLYGTTNDLLFLSSIRTNKYDYAQEAGVFASLKILKRDNDNHSFIPFVREVVTNTNFYSKGLQRLMYCHLHNMCKKDYVEVYSTNELTRICIAEFFLERAALEDDCMLYVDRVACELNPSYRHSQQRRDNLAKLRPVGLTGEQAEIYNARQRDAQPKENK